MCWSRVTIEFLIVARPLPWRVFMTASITRTSTESTSISPNKPSSARSASAPNRTMRLTLDQRRKRGLGKGSRQEVNVNRAKQAKQIQISMWCASSRAAGGCVSRSLSCCLYLSPAFLLSLSFCLSAQFDLLLFSWRQVSLALHLTPLDAITLRLTYSCG